MTDGEKRILTALLRGFKFIIDRLEDLLKEERGRN